MNERELQELREIQERPIMQAWRILAQNHQIDGSANPSNALKWFFLCLQMLLGFTRVLHPVYRYPLGLALSVFSIGWAICAFLGYFLVLLALSAIPIWLLWWFFVS